MRGKRLRDLGTGEVRDPAFLVGEQADRDEVRRFAHVEPVARAVGHADEVASLAEHFVDLRADVQRELAGAGDEKAHFIFAVRVLVEELLAECRRDPGCPA